MGLVEIALDGLLVFYILAGSAPLGYIFLRLGWPGIRALDRQYKAGWSIVIGVVFSAVVVFASLAFSFNPFFAIGFREALLLNLSMTFIAATALLTIKRKYLVRNKLKVSVPTTLVGTRMTAKKVVEQLEKEPGYIRAMKFEPEKLDALKRKLDIMDDAPKTAGVFAAGEGSKAVQAASVQPAKQGRFAFRGFGNAPAQSREAGAGSPAQESIVSKLLPMVVPVKESPPAQNLQKPTIAAQAQPTAQVQQAMQTQPSLAKPAAEKPETKTIAPAKPETKSTPIWKAAVQEQAPKKTSKIEELRKMLDSRIAKKDAKTAEQGIAKAPQPMTTNENPAQQQAKPAQQKQEVVAKPSAMERPVGNEEKAQETGMKKRQFSESDVSIGWGNENQGKSKPAEARKWEAATVAKPSPQNEPAARAKKIEAKPSEKKIALDEEDSGNVLERLLKEKRAEIEKLKKARKK